MWSSCLPFLMCHCCICQPTAGLSEAGVFALLPAVCIPSAIPLCVLSVTLRSVSLSLLFFAVNYFLLVLIADGQCYVLARWCLLTCHHPNPYSSLTMDLFIVFVVLFSFCFVVHCVFSNILCVCSASGGGTQSRTVTCVSSDSPTSSVSDLFCTSTKPATSQGCNTQACGECFGFHVCVCATFMFSILCCICIWLSLWVAVTSKNINATDPTVHTRRMNVHVWASL